MDAVNEALESENEVLDNEVLPPDRKLYRQWNPPTIKYNGGKSNTRYMGWTNLIVGSHDLHNVVKAYVNMVNATITFFEPTPQTNIITHETRLKQYSIKQGLKVFEKKARLQYKNNCSSFMIK